MAAPLATAESSDNPWLLRLGIALVLGIAFAVIAHKWAASYYAFLAESGSFAHRENRFAVQQSSTTGSSALGFLLIGGLGAALAITAPPQRLRWSHPLLLLFALYAGWCFASYTWTEFHFLTIRKLAILTLLILGAIGIAVRCSLTDMLWIIILLVAGELTIGFAAEIANGMFRPWRSDYRYAGTLDPNGIGLEAAVMTLAAWLVPFERRNRPYVRAALIALGLGVVVMTKSRTTLAALVAAGMVAFLLRARGQQRWWIATATITLACLGGLAVNFVSVAAIQESADVASMGRNEDVSTLTGRLPLWQALTKEAERTPWFGHGYGSFWTPTRIYRYSDEFMWHIPHAHNTYLDHVLAIGLVGLALYLLWMLGLAVAGWVRYDRAGHPADLFAACFVTLCLVHGLAESKIPGSGPPTLLLFTCVAALALKPAVAPASTTAAEPPAPREPLVWRPARRFGV